MNLKKSLIFSNVFFIILSCFLMTKTHTFSKLFPKENNHYDYWAVQSAVNGWDRTIESLNIDSVNACFLGNSITWGGFSRAFPDKKIITLAFPGDHLKGIASRVSMMRHFKTRNVFLMGGINGLNNVPLDSTKSMFYNTIDSIKKYAPEATIYVQSILPLNNKLKDDGLKVNPKIIVINDFLKKNESACGYVYIDLYSLYAVNGELPLNMTKDGIHLNSDAYKIWYNKITPYLK